MYHWVEAKNVNYENHLINIQDNKGGISLSPEVYIETLILNAEEECLDGIWPPLVISVICPWG